MRLTTLAIPLTLTLLISAALPDDASAKRGKIPVLLQITNLTEGDVEDPRLRSERGETITFTATGDPDGILPFSGGREVFLARTIYHPTAPETIVQVTSTPAPYESYNASRSTDETFASGRPQAFAFVSTGDLDPSVGNSDHNPEIFIYNIDTQTIHQITDTQPPVVNDDPFLSDSGRCMVFSSNATVHEPNNVGQDPDAPPSGFTNEDESQEIFLWALNTSQDYPTDSMFTQASDGPAGTVSARPVIGGYWFPRQCQNTAFMSDHDQLGNGAQGQHIYIFNRPSGTLGDMTAAETPFGMQPGNYFKPHISIASNFARGPYVVFHTDSNLWLNESTGLDIFRYRAFHPRMTQYTDQDVGDAKAPVISDGGGWIAFHSNGEVLRQNKPAKSGELPPFNPDGNEEIFRLRGRRKVMQITQSENCDNTQPSIQDNGTGIAFRSTCDLIPGQNPNNLPQVFFYTQVKDKDPLVGAVSCQVQDGCCNEANGCFNKIEGRQPKISKKNCETKSKGCK